MRPRAWACTFLKIWSVNFKYFWYKNFLFLNKNSFNGMIQLIWNILHTIFESWIFCKYCLLTAEVRSLSQWRAFGYILQLVQRVIKSMNNVAFHHTDRMLDSRQFSLGKNSAKWLAYFSLYEDDLPTRNNYIPY